MSEQIDIAVDLGVVPPPLQIPYGEPQNAATTPLRLGYICVYECSSVVFFCEHQLKISIASAEELIYPVSTVRPRMQ